MTRPWIVIPLLLLSLFSRSSERISPQEEYNWAYQQFFPVFDELMPMKGTAGSYAVYRAHSESEIPEYWFSIGYEPKENGDGMQDHLSAQVRIADMRSIFSQIMHAHRDEPQQTITAIEKTIRLKTFDLKETTCPAMKQQVEILEKLQVDVPKFHDPGVFVFGHRKRSEFLIQQDWEQMTVVFAELLVNDQNRQQNPLVNWADSTRRVLDTCAQAH